MNIYSEYAIEHVTVYVRSMKKLQEKWRQNVKRVIKTCVDTSGFAESYVVVRQFRKHKRNKQSERYIVEVKFVYNPANVKEYVQENPDKNSI